MALPARARRPARDRGADGGELQAAEPKWPPPQPDAYHAVAAQPGALGGHLADGRLPGPVHGLHQQAERSQITPPRYPGGGRRGVAADDPHGPRQSYPRASPAGVDGGTEHLADRLKTHATNGGELLGGQRGPPCPARPGSRRPGPGGSGQFVAHIPSLGPLLTGPALPSGTTTDPASGQPRHRSSSPSGTAIRARARRIRRYVCRSGPWDGSVMWCRSGGSVCWEGLVACSPHRPGRRGRAGGQSRSSRAMVSVNHFS